MSKFATENYLTLKIYSKMKKYLMTGVAAIAMVGAMTSCSHEDEAAQYSNLQSSYIQAFNNTFGVPAADQDWGFGEPAAATSRMTRAITVNGDNYDEFTFPTTEELAAAFPTAVPGTAKTDAELETLYKGTTVSTEYGNQTLYDLYAIYQRVVGITEMDVLVSDPGEYSVGHSYANPASQVYNVYINVGKGNSLTLKRNGAEHVNFYILSGNVTIDKDFGECGGIISVAAGATVNDQRDHIAHNTGLKVYNRGTWNATNTTAKTEWVVDKNVSYCYAIGNNVKFYNEAIFDASGAIAYNSGAGNTAWFYNVGDDVELTAPSMTLNSTCNFFSDGNVTISGETFVTKDGIVWVNNGHYTTGSITWSAKNTSFYNYCQLIVEGNAHMYDGEFNLMDNSYTEAGSAEMDNFIVKMGNDAGIYIKGDVDIKAQGDGTFQGFKSNGTNQNILIDGMVTVASHRNTLSIESGITYSINHIQIIKAGEVVTEAYLQEKGDGDYPVLDLQGTECPYGELSVVPNTTSCGATWSRGSTPINYDVRIIAEDLTATQGSDFDFNDVVFDVHYTSATTATITLLAAGGTLPITVAGRDVHQLFEAEVYEMINTNAPARDHGVTRAPVSFDITGIDQTKRGADIPIMVQKDGAWEELMANKGVAAAKIAVKQGFVWCNEYVNITTVYPLFKDYVHNKDIIWY